MTEQSTLCAANTRSDFHVEFDGLDAAKRGAVVRFRVIANDPEDGDQPAFGLDFLVEAADDGMDGLLKRGYDQLIEALQQMLWEADVQRSRYIRA